MLYVRPEDADKITCMQDVIDGGYTFGPVFPNGGIYKAMVEWNEANGSPLDEIPVQADISVAERIELVVSGQCDVYVETVNTDVEEVAAEMGVELVQVEEPLTAEKQWCLLRRKTPSCVRLSIMLLAPTWRTERLLSFLTSGTVTIFSA